MAEPTSSSTGIDALLQQRAQYEQWLARLDATGNRTPDAVRERVRADYQQRLTGVVEQLRSHVATISGELEGHRRRQEELEGRRDDVQDRLAEAEVRHAVGEYSEDEWRRISEETGAEVASIHGALAQVTEEIARLAEVERLVMAPGAPPAAPRDEPAAADHAVMATSSEPAAAELPEPAAEPEAAAAPLEPAPLEPDPVVPEPVAPEPPMPVAAAPEAPAPPAPDAEDEMAFLQSVTGGHEAQRPAPPVPAAPAAAPRTAPSAPAAAAPTGAKTLKCGECGTLNRPTEWYCERCGAELSAL
jgi:hypothetical protein